LQTIANEACHTVLLLLGLGVTMPVDSSLPPALQLAPWLEGRARLNTTVTEQAARQPGRPGDVAGIGIEVSIQVDSAQ
jgi:hypothetical protein